jgi:hypothetical protein
MNKKIFTVQQGSSSTIKVFDGETGSLYKIIATGGNIVSPPYVAGHLVSVTVEHSGKRFAKTFTLPGGGLTSTMPL